jgi:hypothetical protein
MAKSCKFSKATKGGPIDPMTNQPDPPPMYACKCAGKAMKISACSEVAIANAEGGVPGWGILKADRKNPTRGFIAASGLGMGKAFTVKMAKLMATASKDTTAVVMLKGRTKRKRK